MFKRRKCVPVSNIDSIISDKEVLNGESVQPSCKLDTGFYMDLIDFKFLVEL